MACLKGRVALEDPHHILLSADKVPGACVHVRVRRSWCHVLLGQEVSREQRQPRGLGGSWEQEQLVWDSSWFLARTVGFDW